MGGAWLRKDEAVELGLKIKLGLRSQVEWKPCMQCAKTEAFGQRKNKPGLKFQICSSSPVTLGRLILCAGSFHSL